MAPGERGRRSSSRDYRRNDRRSNSPRGGGGRRSRSPPRGGGRRGGGRSRDRSRSRGGNDRRRDPPRDNGRSRQEDRGAANSASSAAPVAPAAPEEPAETVTLEQRQNSIECDGHLYATMDFTAPIQLPEYGVEDMKKSYKPSDRSKGLKEAKLPAGWEVATISDTVLEKVVKPFPWGTHLIVFEDGKAYQTSKGGERPGCLEMLWDIARTPDKKYYLQQKAGFGSKWHGRILIKSVCSFS
mmetsp:Transcript_47267/g.76618  ORF Transcript_47267/g.76618 Transcript_47267/m.76618 type:complete len:241 (-) Transcript_47267:82-804(-)